MDCCRWRLGQVTKFLLSKFVNLTARSKKTGDERSMVVERIVIHPNFTDYKDDLGKLTFSIQAFAQKKQHCANVLSLL